MTSNGKRRQRKPQIEVIAPSASEEESAAIAAALEQFIAETAPPPRSSAQISRWQRAALVEGVGAEPGLDLSRSG